MIGPPPIWPKNGTLRGQILILTSNHLSAMYSTQVIQLANQGFGRHFFAMPFLCFWRALLFLESSAAQVAGSTFSLTIYFLGCSSPRQDLQLGISMSGFVGPSLFFWLDSLRAFWDDQSWILDAWDAQKDKSYVKSSGIGQRDSSLLPKLKGNVHSQSDAFEDRPCSVCLCLNQS